MNFNTTQNPCVFDFWTADPLFSIDADRIVVFVLRKLGEDILQVELTKKQIWACFEEAAWKFNSLIIEYQQKSNLASLLGLPTGSIDPVTNKNIINFTNVYVHPTLDFLNRQAEAYAGELGLGSMQDTYSGSFTLTNGQQDYDLYSDLKDGNGTPLYNLQPSGSTGKMYIHEVYHFAPIQYVFNSNLASNFVASGLPVESYVPDTRFYVLPLFEDVLRAQQLKSAQRVRRSHYSYKMSGRKIRIFPQPNSLIPNYNDKVWVRVGFRQHASPSQAYTLTTSGSSYQSTNPTGTFVDDTIFGANSPANVPLGLIEYKSLNPWARNWIAAYTEALCTILLGRIRSKFSSLPIPGGENLQLNGTDLVTQGREDKDKLVETLTEKLENLSWDKLQQRESERAEALQKQLSFLAIPPHVVIALK